MVLCRPVTMWWLPLLLVIALILMTSAERFTEPQAGARTTIADANAPLSGTGRFATVTRPDAKDPIWSSKIMANTPFGTDPAGYVTALAAFYDTVYTPATARPAESDVDTFVKTPFPGTDPDILKTLIMESFHIDAAGKGAAAEQNQVVFEPSAKLLEPSDGRDEVRDRVEDEYEPEDTTGPFDQSPEGQFEPTPQTVPSRAGRRRRELSPIENV